MFSYFKKNKRNWTKNTVNELENYTLFHTCLHFNTSQILLSKHTYLRWIKDEIINSTGARMDPPVLDPVDDGVERNVQVDHNIYWSFSLKCFSLESKK